MSDYRFFTDGQGIAFMVVLVIVSGVVGWCVIEGLIWFFSHIDIAWVTERE